MYIIYIHFLSCADLSFLCRKLVFFHPMMMDSKEVSYVCNLVVIPQEIKTTIEILKTKDKLEIFKGNNLFYFKNSPVFLIISHINCERNNFYSGL